MFFTFIAEKYARLPDITPMMIIALILNVTIVFWNLENFFAPEPEGEKHWTYSRFHAKCESIAKTIMLISDSEGKIPDVIGFAEVGDRTVLERLLWDTILQKSDYRIIHFDSPDHRGIDCALLYRTSTLISLFSQPCHLYEGNGEIMKTRDILLAKFLDTSGDTLAVLVNHHPSKVGGNSSGSREIAMETMLHICDSLTCATVCIGDFNDGALFKGEGTYKYNGKWEKLDGCFHFRTPSLRERVFSHPFLSIQDRAHGGVKPKRTYIGPRYQGGVSDHYPIIIDVEF